MARTKKPKIKYQEKYRKGSVILDNDEVKKIMEDNQEKMVIEMRERTIYDNGDESMVIELKFN